MQLRISCGSPTLYFPFFSARANRGSSFPRHDQKKKRYPSSPLSRRRGLSPPSDPQIRRSLYMELPYSPSGLSARWTFPIFLLPIETTLFPAVGFWNAFPFLLPKLPLSAKTESFFFFPNFSPPRQGQASSGRVFVSLLLWRARPSSQDGRTGFLFFLLFPFSYSTLGVGSGVSFPVLSPPPKLLQVRSIIAPFSYSLFPGICKH